MLWATLVVTLCVLWAAAAASSTIHFAASFDESLLSASADPLAGWQVSNVDKYRASHSHVRVRASSTAPTAFKQDLGLHFGRDMLHYAVGKPLDHPVQLLSTEDQLVFQYEVKFEEGLTCGGAYVKLLRGTSDVSAVDGDTPYAIMFGPDRCGGTNKVHFIVQHFNPLSQAWEEKHFNQSIPIHGDKNTHLYGLVLHGNNDFELRIDDKVAKKGNLLTHMTPAINPEKYIADPNDVRPATWDEREKIPDPEATKPDDWDESQPRKIADPKAVKPTGWLDDAPLKIPDPEAKKPDDWLDEEDGDWEAPLVDNPACERVGCGVWTAPTIDNPNYKGKWKAPLIANPAYQGIWKPRQIENPAFFEDLKPALTLAPITALAVEIWTTNPALHFDNFVLGSSLEAVDKFTSKFHTKATAEKSELDANRKAERAKKDAEKLEKGTFTQKVEVYVGKIVDFIEENPVPSIGTAVGLVVAFIYLLIAGSRQKAEFPKEDVAATPENTASNDVPSTENQTVPVEAEEKKNEEKKD